MKNIADPLQQYYKTNGTFPQLWYEYIPETQAVFPSARFEFVGFSRQYASNDISMDRYQIQFAIFDTDAAASFDLGQAVLSHMSDFNGDDVVMVRCVPETFSTPVDAGGRTVWGFRFTMELVITHPGG